MTPSVATISAIAQRQSIRRWESSEPPIIAQAVGTKRKYLRDSRRSVRQGLWVTLTVAIPGTVVMWHAASVLRLLGQDPAIADYAQDYTRALAPGLLPAIWFIVLRNFVAACASAPAAVRSRP